jgi:hypothetical protein
MRLLVSAGELSRAREAGVVADGKAMLVQGVEDLFVGLAREEFNLPGG